ncbi:MAG: hypothetical protein EHM79_05475 [Geobacter sp.]|nr:MAG: hypothetical protein EHM79_05475 [Geobacter sp.]
MQNHVSRQLAKSVEMRQAIEATGLVTEIQELLTRSKHILRRAERDGKLGIALGAIRETKGVLELMARICSTVYQIQAMDLQAQQAEQEDQQSASQQEGLNLLSDAELTMYIAIVEKMCGERTDDVITAAMQEIRNTPQAYNPPEPKRARRKVQEEELQEEKPLVLEPLHHIPLDLDSLELDEPRSKAGTWGQDKTDPTGFADAVKSGSLSTPYTIGVRH